MTFFLGLSFWFERFLRLLCVWLLCYKKYKSHYRTTLFPPCTLGPTISKFFGLFSLSVYFFFFYQPVSEVLDRLFPLRLRVLQHDGLSRLVPNLKKKTSFKFPPSKNKHELEQRGWPCPAIYLSIGLFIYLFIYLPIWLGSLCQRWGPSGWPRGWPLTMSSYLSIHLSTCMAGLSMLALRFKWLAKRVTMSSYLSIHHSIFP